MDEQPKPIGDVLAFFAAAGAVIALSLWLFASGTDRLMIGGTSVVMAVLFYLGGRLGSVR